MEKDRPGIKTYVNFGELFCYVAVRQNWKRGLGVGGGVIPREIYKVPSQGLGNTYFLEEYIILRKFIWVSTPYTLMC